MPIASGFIVVLNDEEIDRIKNELIVNNVEIIRAEDRKIVYLIERPTMQEIEHVLKFMKSIDGIENVYLAYYTLSD